MRSRSALLALTALTAASVAFAPATAQITEVEDETETAETETEAAPAADCEDTVGREVLTTEGLTLDVAAPGVTAPELQDSAAITGEAVTPHRTAHFFLTVDLAPHERASLDASIEWPEMSSDYDLYVYTYTEGIRHLLAESKESNIDGGDTRIEDISATVGDCQMLDIEIRSWAGSPAQDITLDLQLTPEGEPRTDVTARPADGRVGLYLAGDRPGNLTPPQDTAGDAYPFMGRFSEERPTANVPNLTTRPVAGSTIEKNPFQPWWAGQLDGFPVVQGNPSALVWLSSPTQQQDPGTVFVQLFLNGQEHTVEIPGSELTHEVRPFLVQFPEVDTQVGNFSLQVSTDPIVSPNDQSEHTGDANHTVWYDSVQYQSKLYLPVADAA